MTRIANRDRRPYHSELRADQAEATRSRILDATLRVMAGGAATLSIPAVAREAGVSVPTVYRHFGSKPDLLTALYPHVVRRAGLDALEPPDSLDGVREAVRGIIDRLDAIGDLARAAMASPGAEEARRATMAGRFRAARRLADSVDPPLADADARRLARLIVVLTTSSALGAWRDHLGASADETADDIEWVVRAVIAGSSRMTH